MKSASERYSLLNSMSFQHPIASDISMVTIDYHSLITDGGFNYYFIIYKFIAWEKEN